MKIAVITSRERCEKFSDKSMIPEGAELVYFEQGYTAREVIERAGDAEFAVIDAVLPFTAEMIEGMPKLRMIHSEGVGYAAIDIAAAAKRGIPVCNNQGVNAPQVAEHTVMLILTVLRRFAEGEAAVRAGRQMEMKLRVMADGMDDLIGKRVGLIGFGAIGKELAKRLLPFGCGLFYTDPSRALPEVEAQYEIACLTQEELLRTSDIVTLHVPVTPSTTNLINRNTLSMMKPNAVIVNCARGAVVNTADLAEAIRNGTIRGCALDVMEPEPFRPDDPILTLPEPWRWRVAVSPHIAGNTINTFYASYDGIWGDIRRVLRGEKPRNIVNGL